MTKRNNDLVKEVMSDYLNRKEARKSLETGWLLNANFYAGNQFAEIMPNGEIRDNGKDYYWQSREVFNHIAPIIETRLAKFAGVGVGVTVRPATGDSSDVNAAKFSTALLKSVQEENDFKKLTREAIFWAEICGTSFYKVSWSNEKGAFLSPSLREGDVDVTVCPPYEIYPDNLSARDLSEVKSLIHAKAYPASVVEEVWQVKVKGGEVDVLSPEIPLGRYNGRTGMLPEVKKDYVVVVERYTLPDKKNPEGRLTVVGGNKLLYDGILPYINGKNGERGFPFVRQTCLEKPASFFGTGIIDRLIPVQRAYNAIKNRKHEYLNRMAMGILMVEDGSVDVDSLQEEGLAPGKVVIYRQGSNVPVMLNMGGVPNEFYEEENRLLSEFVTVSGVSDFLTSSTISSSNVSGVALNLIIEQDNNRLSITIGSIKNASRELGRQVLRLYKQFASDLRLKRICGENGETELKSFNANDITGDDIVFDVESETVDSVTARKSMAEDLLRLGVFNDENGKITDTARLKLLEIMGFGNWENALSTKELHVKRAAKENIDIKDNAPEIQDTDDHSLHIEEHIRYMISEENDLSEQDRKTLSEHIRRHRVYLRLTDEADRLNQNT